MCDVRCLPLSIDLRNNAQCQKDGGYKKLGHGGPPCLHWHHWPDQRLRTAHPSQPPYSGPITVTMQSASAYSLLPPVLSPPMPANSAETIDNIAARQP